MVIDLRKGFGDFEDYKLFKFPDNSIKFELKDEISGLRVILEEGPIEVKTTLRTSDDLLILGLVKSVLDVNFNGYKVTTVLSITYMMYQQDDRCFSTKESFGLKFISNYINSLNFNFVEIFHPHSDKVEFINNVEILDNTPFIKWVLDQFKEPPVWVIPDSGAFKTQFKQIEKLGHKDFITCMKSRDHVTGEITTVVNSGDLTGKECIIFDDLCLGGATFLGISKKLYEKGCRNMNLAISHGVFNMGVAHLISVFNTIYTTDSICTLAESDRLKIMKL